MINSPVTRATLPLRSKRLSRVKRELSCLDMLEYVSPALFFVDANVRLDRREQMNGAREASIGIDRNAVDNFEAEAVVLVVARKRAREDCGIMVVKSVCRGQIGRDEVLFGKQSSASERGVWL